MKKRVCLLVALLALVIMGFTMNVEAAEIIDRGYCGGEGDGTNLTWTLDSDGVLVIEGQGRMKDWSRDESIPYYSDFRPTDWHKYDGDINSVMIRNGIINIGDYAFYYCKSLGSIVMPESIASIGGWAFGDCLNLSSINLPESVTCIGGGAFAYCESLSSIVLPESIMTFGDHAFLGSAISSINIPKSITYISAGAFAGCKSLGSIVLPESITEIRDYAFGDCGISSIILPESITYIGHGAFSHCKWLSRIVLPESVTSIGENAFSYCVNLRSIHLPKSLAYIGIHAFESCCRLTSIVLPESLTDIEINVFVNCFDLRHIYIPKSVRSIYLDAFDFTNIKDICYGGTKEEWNNISIGRWFSSDTDFLGNTTIHYADDDIDYEKLNEFVSRLYRNFLKREPDEKGLADWIGALCSGKTTGAKVVSGFVLSPEYKANTLSNEEYVTALYRIVFNRDPDDAGLNAWVAVIENGYTNKKVLAGFVNSDEFDNLCRDLGIATGSYKSDEAVDQSDRATAFVARLYEVCLGRAYEQDGLDNWVRALTSGTADTHSVVKDFFNSEEFKNRNLDDTEFVTVAYKTILDREPDELGLENWVDNLSSGYTRDDVLQGFLYSQEFWFLEIAYGLTT